MLIDTHAHIHFEGARDQLDGILERAHKAGVEKIITVGVEEHDSAQAIAVAKAYEFIWASVGLHPTEAERGYEALDEIARLAEFEKVVAIGECGLDYYHEGFDRDAQARALRFQIELGLERDLAMIFHVRDAFGDFYRILDDYSGVRGVIHCFTAGVKEMEMAVDRGLLVALNGIMTFSKDEAQLEAARQIPLNNLVLETDTPYLAPVPMRGKPNEPSYTAYTAEFLAELRQEPFEDLAGATTRNAEELFRI
jgi:TatD DNase family protein